MTRVARKRMHHRVRDVKRSSRTRARVKDLDQIHDDLKKPEVLTNQAEDPDLPGMGQHYCLECARYFTCAAALEGHLNSKQHKKRLKVLKDEPYTQKEADAAAGLGVDTSDQRHHHQSQPLSLQEPVSTNDATMSS